MKANAEAEIAVLQEQMAAKDAELRASQAELLKEEEAAKLIGERIV